VRPFEMRTSRQSDTAETDRHVPTVPFGESTTPLVRCTLFSVCGVAVDTVIGVKGI
jgi:hypothetical protein